jgi:hypothetical protein
VPTLAAPSLVFAMSHGGHCATCEHRATLPCLIACLGISALVGTRVGVHAIADAAPRRFAVAAIARAGFTGLLGRGTTGFRRRARRRDRAGRGRRHRWTVAGRTAQV